MLLIKSFKDNRLIIRIVDVIEIFFTYKKNNKIEKKIADIFAWAILGFSYFV